MIVRRLAARRLVRSGSTEEEPRRKRAARFVLAILVAGVLSGAAAWLGVWPFGGVHAMLQKTFGPPQQLPALAVFPAVQPTHKTVDVYDPAPPARSSQPPVAAPTAAPSSKPTPSHSPRPSGTPTPAPDE